MRRPGSVPVVTFLLAAVAGLTSFDTHKAGAPEPVYPVPTEQQLAWHEMEMNAFIHFTVNTFTDLEWGMGGESESVFNPSAADPGQWVNVLSQAGFKGVILTCKHHDGFCLWPSKYTEHSVKNSPFQNGKGDLVRDLSQACRLKGMKFGVYLSPWDRNQATYGSKAYIDYYREQLTELFTSYGPIFEMWFDGANGGTGYYGGANENRSIDGKTYYDWPGTLKLVCSIQPQVLFFSDAGPDIRWVGNENGTAGETNWNMITPDTLYAGKAGINDLLNHGSENGSRWIPAETDVSIRPGWFWHEKENNQVKSPEQLLDIYLNSVGRGSVLLLNVPPDKRGLIHGNDIQSLAGFGSLLKKEFGNNLAFQANVKASNVRGNDPEFAAINVTDGKKESYWATDDGTNKASLEIDLGSEKKIRYIMLQEYIRLGQRVKAFEVEVLQGNSWTKAATATTIGYKRILKIDPVLTRRIRINITDSRACPVISNVEVY
jgi:alpha-L-fucosidase